MKIYHAAETIKGGVATVIDSLASAQIGAGHQVMCLVPEGHARELRSVPDTSISVFRRPRRGVISSLIFCFALVRLVSSGKPDVQST